MEKERRAFEAFLSLNAKKASTTPYRAAHVQFQSETMRPGDPLLLMEQDDILKELDSSSPLVQWLLNQLNTYDCTRQKIVCLIFDKKTVLSDVLWDNNGGEGIKS